MNYFNIKWAIKSRIKRFFFKIVYRDSVSFGERLTFRDGFHIIMENGAKLKIGNRAFFNNNCSINVLNKVTIGDDCLFGENVKIYDHDHCFKYEGIPFHSQLMNTSEILIGNNCWFGSNVVILRGSKIGNNCVIAAGTVVKTNLEDGMILYRDGTIQSINFREKI